MPTIKKYIAIVLLAVAGYWLFRAGGDYAMKRLAVEMAQSNIGLCEIPTSPPDSSEAPDSPVPESQKL